jgi:hypothetical protein
MKKALCIAIIVSLAFSLFSPALSAAAILDYTVSPARVDLNQAGKGSFTITVAKPETPYGGIQIRLKLPESYGVMVESVVYGAAGNTIAPQYPPNAASREELFFSLYSSSNVYDDALSCTVNVIYPGAAQRVVEIAEIKTNTYVGVHAVDSLSSGRNTASVVLVPYGSGGGGDGDGEKGGEGEDGEDGEGNKKDDPENGKDNTRGPGGNQGGTNNSTRANATAKNDPPATVPDLPAPKAPEGGMFPALDKSNLKAYLSGYPDGTARPLNNITRAETASMLFALVINGDKNDYLLNASQFTDVGYGKWYSHAVGYLSTWEIIRGYPDGTFQGDKFISRAEFTAILSRFERLDESGSLAFTDVAPGHWAYGNILGAVNSKWIFGYPDNTFRPGNEIIRAEAIAMVNRVIGRYAAAYEASKMKFSDVVRDWYYNDILAASNSRP